MAITRRDDKSSSPSDGSDKNNNDGGNNGNGNDNGNTKDNSGGSDNTNKDSGGGGGGGGGNNKDNGGDNNDNGGGNNNNNGSGGDNNNNNGGGDNNNNSNGRGGDNNNNNGGGDNNNNNNGSGGDNNNNNNGSGGDNNNNNNGGGGGNKGNDNNNSGGGGGDNNNANSGGDNNGNNNNAGGGDANNSNNNNGNSGSNNNNNNGGGNNNNNNNKNNNNTPSSSTNNQSPAPPRSSSGSKGGSKHSPPAIKGGSSSSDDSSSSIQSDTKMIAGVVVGAIVLLAIIITIACVCRKRKKRREAMQYYDMRTEPQKASASYQSAQHAPWGGQGGGMHQDMKMNYSGDAGMSSANWGPAMPPPPPPQMMSSDMSSANYSGPSLPPPHPAMVLGFNKSTFTYEELAAATNGFSQANMIGQGGFGYVHKGILPNGKEIAIKSLKSGSGQGDREFQAEVDIISRVHHRHLVSLVGYCVGTGGQRMLVYEFIPNNTLEYHLHGKGRPVMDFPTRMRIALGSAKGLAYLHEDCHPRIIHRDIKSANILIDNSFEAKVADFGLAKLNDTTHTHVSTRVMGTFGYLAPEYAASGKLTEKSDVFSFGVMLLELVTGRRPIDASEEEDSLVDWSRPFLPRALEEGVFDGLVDPRLEGNYDQQEMLRLIACAAASIRHSAKRRPKMSQIVRALEGDATLEDLNEPVKKPSAPNSDGHSSEYDTVCYNNDMKQFRKIVMDSSDYGSSSDYGTNEYRK